jgi:F-type H+-transporting ATPase subunit delta
MLKDIIAKRYAKALLELAEASGETEAVKADLDSVAGAYADSKELRDVFLNPNFTDEDRLGVLKGLLAHADVKELSAKFMDLLARKGRFRFICEAAASYTELLDIKLGKVKATIVSAQPLEADALEKVKDRIRTMVGKEVELDIEVDAELIGGIKTRIGSTVYDGSIKNQLGQARRALLG